MLVFLAFNQIKYKMIDDSSMFFESGRVHLTSGKFDQAIEPSFEERTAGGLDAISQGI